MYYKTHIIERETSSSFCRKRRDPSISFEEFVSRYETNSIDLDALCGECRKKAEDYALRHKLFWR